MHWKPYNIRSGKNFRLLENYQTLLPKTSVVAEYIWIGGSGQDIRSKTRVIPNKTEIKSISELPTWSFDGSSTGQATGTNSDVLLKPVKIVPDPFRRGSSVLVLCETFDSQWKPLASNRRAFARGIFEDEKVVSAKPWFGLEQEYTLYTPDGLRPLGFPSMGNPPPQGQYYCATGVDNAFGRHLGEIHLYASLHAGLANSGVNAEVMPGQWEYQIGPVAGIDAADQLWLARYMMAKLAEDLEVLVSLDPKPLKEGDWNGAGCHCNFSTQRMREEDGLQEVFDAVKALEPVHMEHMALYGSGNQRRMTGLHETAKYDEFSYAVANRGCSVRITRETAQNKCGFFEDRRPSSNCDPYNVTAMICKTTIIDRLSK